MSLRLAMVPLISMSLLAFSTNGEPAIRMHLHLTSSTPAADAMVHEVKAIELTFSETPQEGSVSMRLVDAAGESVGTPRPEAVGEGGEAFSIVLADPLTAGPYTISWRAMGGDGHVVKGDFAFTLMNHGDPHLEP